MILSRTPFRMSFVGGGSDISSFYRDEMGAVLSSTLNKYMYIALNNKFDQKIRVSYSKVEEVDEIKEIKHPLVRETLKFMQANNGIEISSFADIPSHGSGLGSSSAYTVGLLNALYAHKGQNANKDILAKQACEIEINRCNEPIGKQDQFACSYGGLRVYKFFPDETVISESITCTNQVLNKFENSILVFYTGRTRRASSILYEQTESLKTNKSKLFVRRMVDLVFVMKAELERGELDNIGSILNENWLLKKELALGITDDEINFWYSVALKNGAKGGKILGAGNGGFLLLYAPVETHEKIISSLSFLKHVDFKFENHGSRIIYNDTPFLKDCI